MIYGYIRVSTDKQTTENQRFELLKYADEKKLHIDLGSRSLGTHIGKPLKNRRCLSRDGAIWACANLRDGVKIIDLPLVSARHTERSRTHATHWSHHRSPSTNTDEFSRGPNQEVKFFFGLGPVIN
jgi:hypothetical protein